MGIQAPEKITVHGFIEGAPEREIRTMLGEPYFVATFRVRTLDRRAYRCVSDNPDRIIERLGAGERVTVDGWLSEGELNALSVSVPPSAKYR